MDASVKSSATDAHEGAGVARELAQESAAIEADGHSLDQVVGGSESGFNSTGPRQSSGNHTPH